MDIFKRKKEKIYDDSWMYTLLLSTIVILGESLKSYTFPIKGIELTFAIFLLPIIFFLTNYITKKYNFMRSISAICLSTVALVVFTYSINYALGRTVDFLSIGGEVSGYLIAQMINLYIYVFLLNNTSSPTILVLINYLFALIVFYMFFTLINLSVLVTDTYWLGYFITLFIQLIECIIISIVDKFIKRGAEKK